jgi:hypothetical protein
MTVGTWNETNVKKPWSRSHSPRRSPTDQDRERERAGGSTLRREDADHRDDVLEIADEQPAADQREVLDRVRALGNHFTPSLARRVLEIDREDAVPGGVPIGVHVQPVPREARAEGRVEIVHQRPRRSAVDEIDRVQRGVLAGRAAVDGDQQPAAVGRQRRNHDHLRTEVLAEDQRVGRRLAAEDVVPDARSFRGLDRVVEAVAGRLERDAEVACPRESVGQVSPARQVAEGDLDLVLAPGAERVRH